jgi:hypothetical protein
MSPRSLYAPLCNFPAQVLGNGWKNNEMFRAVAYSTALMCKQKGAIALTPPPPPLLLVLPIEILDTCVLLSVAIVVVAPCGTTLQMV